ncbi:helix-turn-helix domain-containing protein [Salmonella enterica subsp. salamae]|uniref:helix-turn-helix domain-containing protein n=1 Tax=Salmonella sp. NW826 TaxID=2948311 RepID=UPI0012862F0C|nr:helix-turn-helix domain-containing protein [Salmonella enterica subsp. salamae]
MERTKNIFSSVVIWIEDNIREDICVNDIVYKSGYSKRNLQYIFKKYLGCGIYTYLKNRRLSLAAKLLKITRMPIIEICNIYHFGSYQSFNRAFTVKFCISPARYRRSPHWLLSRYTGNAALERPKMISGPVLLPRLEIFTINKEFKISFPDGSYNSRMDGDNTPEIKKYARTLVLRNKHKNKLMLAYAFNVNDKSSITLNINVLEVKHQRSHTSSQRQIIEAGMYYHFHYEGSWEEYNSLSDYIYLNELPRLHMNKRNSYDLEVFDISAMRGDTNVIVDFYVAIVPDSNFVQE